MAALAETVEVEEMPVPEGLMILVAPPVLAELRAVLLGQRVCIICLEAMAVWGARARAE